MAKEKKEKNKDSVKKPFYKKWWFWVIVVIVLATIFGNSGNKDSNTPDTVKTSTEQEKAQEENSSQEEETNSDNETAEDVANSTHIATVCRALTMMFVEKVVKEDWQMLAFSIEDSELDENGDGTINVLYLPSNAGNGATKVNLTIVKSGNTYTIESALLAGLNEVDMNTVSGQYKTLVD